jgi:hypothetical protein
MTPFRGRAPRQSSDVPPPELRSLDNLLRTIRFEPRASLGPEIVGRVRRGETATQTKRAPRLIRTLILSGLAVLVASLSGRAWRASRRPPFPVVDNRCFDLDGGGKNDDGILVGMAGPGKVGRLAIYEDRLGSGPFRPGDIVRFSSDRAVTVHEPATALRVLRRCCFDLDAGGVADDGILTITKPPGQVTWAAIYETGPDSLPPVLPKR